MGYDTHIFQRELRFLGDKELPTFIQRGVGEGDSLCLEHKLSVFKVPEGHVDNLIGTENPSPLGLASAQKKTIPAHVSPPQLEDSRRNVSGCNQISLPERRISSLCPSLTFIWSQVTNGWDHHIESRQASSAHNGSFLRADR